ncbi:MAG: hypothetical protein F6J95_026960 [Leptolyngbya sp. SIO1E4]|nr:hypothetical protein [Leptolyngbya sp. SIO1E4]
MTSLNLSPNQHAPLSVILTSSGMDVATPGSRFELGVTVHNVGDRSAIVYIFIEERSPLLRQWCHSMQERLALAPDQSGEITLQIEIPATALPEILEYDLVVDGSDSYRDFPPRRYDHYQLQVLPTARTVGGAEDPTFYLDPVSSSQQPLMIQPGVSLPLQVWVDNRAERVDRFRLRGAGLPDDWHITITYPRDTQDFGLMVEAESLGLNPGERGQILVTLMPPINALAGVYIPTLRLISDNQPEMNLLDLVYLQVSPTYQLQPVLQVLRNQVRTQPALFEIQLENLGNTPRDLLLSVENLEDPDSCTYTLDPSQVTPVAPQTTRRVLLTGIPQKWWQRPFYGGGRFFNFRVQVEDAESHPLTVNTLPGNLLWLPRPWWQLLVLLLTALGVLGVVIWLIWWLFFKPPVLPQLLTFEAEDSRYAEANGEFARVSWEIDNVHRIQEVTLVGLSAEEEILSAPLTYTLDSGALPPALLPFCTQQGRRLTCNNVRTNARQPGTYIFELTVVPQGRRPRQPITARSSTVVIEAQPLILPEITDFAPSRLVYQEAGASPAGGSSRADADLQIDAAGIRLNWIVTNPNELAALKLVARADGKSLGELWFEIEPLPSGDIGLPEALADVCQLASQVLVCEDVPTEIDQVGSYQFELTAVARTPPESEAEPILAETEVVTIQPIAPAIAQFQIDGENARPKYLIPVTRGAAPPTITLTWAINGGATTTAELLPVPGPVGLAGNAVLPLNPMGSTLITLQATNPAGDTVARSVQIETFDPNPQDPAAAAAAAAAAAVTAAEENGDETGSAPEGAGALDEGDAVDQERIAPLDEPPRFD